MSHLQLSQLILLYRVDTNFIIHHPHRHHLSQHINTRTIPERQEVTALLWSGINKKNLTREGEKNLPSFSIIKNIFPVNLPVLQPCACLLLCVLQQTNLWHHGGAHV